MVETLYLSHLPYRMAHHKALHELIRGRLDAPKAGEIAQTISAADGASPTRAVWLAINQAQRKAEDTTRVLGKLGVHAVDYWSTHYPRKLRVLKYPPWILFYVGHLPQEHEKTMAIVGARRPNAYGAEIVARFVPALRHRPLQVVSGLAYGIDALAHHFSCECRIPNFAVLGSGIDLLYPADHAPLCERILSVGGGVLSEFPPGTPPTSHNFPFRNRIISGLADLVWVVQGTGKSGTVHTVRHATDQGKPVAATPGDTFSELSEVPHRLIRDGAGVATCPADLDGLIALTDPAWITH